MINLQTIVDELRKAIEPLVKQIYERLTTVTASITNGLKGLINGIQKTVNNIGNTIKGIAGTLKGLAKAVANSVKGVIESGYRTLRNWLSGQLKGFQANVNKTINGLRTLINKLPSQLRDPIRQIFKGFQTEVNKKIDSFRSGIKNIEKTVLGLPKALDKLRLNLTKQATTAITDIIKRIQTSLNQTATAVSKNAGQINLVLQTINLIVAAVKGMPAVIKGITDGLNGIVRGTIKGIDDGIKGIGRGIQDLFTNWNRQRANLERSFNEVTREGGNLGNRIKNQIDNGLNGIRNNIDNAVRGATDRVRNIGDDIVNNAKGATSAVVDNIKGIQKEAAKTSSETLEALKRQLDAGKNLADDGIAGITKNLGGVSKNADDAAKGVKAIFNQTDEVFKILKPLTSTLDTFVKAIPIIGEFLQALQLNEMQSSIEEITRDTNGLRDAIKDLVPRIENLNKARFEFDQKILLAVEALARNQNAAAINILNGIAGIDRSVGKIQPIQFNQGELQKSIVDGVASQLKQGGVKTDIDETKLANDISSKIKLPDGAKNLTQAEITAAIKPQLDAINVAIGSINKEKVNIDTNSLSRQIAEKVRVPEIDYTKFPKPTVDLAPISANIKEATGRIASQISDFRTAFGKSDYELARKIDRTETNVIRRIDRAESTLLTPVRDAEKAAKNAEKEAKEAKEASKGTYQLIGGDELKNGLSINSESLLKQSGFKQYDDLGNSNGNDLAKTIPQLLPMVMAPLFMRAGFQHFPFFAKKSQIDMEPGSTPIPDMATFNQYNRGQLQQQIGVPTPYTVKGQDGQLTQITQKNTQATIEEVNAQMIGLMDNVDVIERMVMHLNGEILKIANVVIPSSDKLDLLIKDSGMKYEEVKRFHPVGMMPGKQNLVELFKGGNAHYVGYNYPEQNDKQEMMQRILWDTQITRTSFSERMPSDMSNWELPGKKEGIGKTDGVTKWKEFVRTINSTPSDMKGARMNNPKLEEWTGTDWKRPDLGTTTDITGRPNVDTSP